MIMFGFVLTASLTTGALDQIPYEKMVDIKKVTVTPAKEPKHYEIEVSFNLIPDMPKGVKIDFVLQRDGIDIVDPNGKVVAGSFTLKEDTRSNLKLKLAPSIPLSVSVYGFQTRINLLEQSAEAKKAIEAAPKRFPPGFDPWYFAYPDQAFKVGTDAEEAAELKEAKTFIRTKMSEFLEFNKQGMVELAKVESGEGYVKDGKVDIDALKKYLVGWVGKMAKSQDALGKAYADDPVLWGDKLSKEHAELLTLGRMVAKRISRNEPTRILKKYNKTISELKLPSPSGFDPNYGYKTTEEAIEGKRKYIEQILDPEKALKDAAAEGDQAAGDPGDGKGEKSGKDEAKDEGTSKKDEKSKSDAKKSSKKKATKKKSSD